MERVIIGDKAFVPFIPYDKIAQAIDKVADRLNEDFNDGGDPPVLLSILSGSIIFCAELLKRLNFPCELAFLKLSSYSGTSSTGVVKVKSSLTASLKGRRVIIIEDIVDTGRTIKAIEDIIKEEGAREYVVCTLLFKPEVYKNSDKPDYVALEIPNRFILGFGLDYDELGRNLKDIYVLEQ